MMKLAIFLCLGLLACSVNGFAEDIKEKITNIFKEILEIINKAAEEVKQQTKNVLSAAFQAIQKFREIALDLVQQVTDKIEDTIEMVINAIRESVAGAKQLQINIDECTKRIQNLNSTGTDIVTNVKDCVVRKLEDFDDQIEFVSVKSENVLKKLSTIREESKQCLEKMNSSSLSDVFGAFTCVNAGAAKASWAATKEVPSLLSQIGKLTYKIATLPTSLTLCTVNEAVRDYAIEAEFQADEINRCIKKKLEAQIKA